ncbi:multidrug ABC transporter permease/ATP-binding protein [Alcanivorax sp. HI0033]|uniref:multidrug ABC transporter permease/ATP-binding protein n=1 Tax=unclassified Alcanivorax TaxID=2638842 RepID=UPI0007B7C6A0|nr:MULTISPECIES: multidrug ABC transporter permease/ATP-binding protein [unclassified Alcanivorax]KZX73410.1 multidrug ABC transporter permease/ATP-binding protein [Alcanivorax sp. HI0011]KZX78894.1 multidrug ABC transporter permease/ATP-binding protein [Alcanivorax sp. HI0013]KZY10690.1 multidrug ABC transporter permease/ATP-binding protein [Alcanivorax sp. HI0035]KZX68748.1 multidrug ABC transporter permease/ATP-binding protein [Alcanivorax sp. HI0003]KZX72828.1 multidrug ABC transporter per
MTLPGLLFSGRKATFVAVVVLSVLSALLSVAVLAFISQRLLAGGAELGMVLVQFALLLLALLATATGAQVTLHRLGHRMVYGLRRDLVRRVLATDIEQLEKVGGPPLLAALSTDTRNLTIAFVHLPELVYGAALSVAALSWLAWLSPALFAVTVVWLVATAGMGIWLVGRINFHVGKVREGDDHLYQDYQAMIDGRKELALNRARAARFYQEEFDDHARAYRDHVTRADIFNGVAGNMANVLMLALIGVLFYLASGLGWASANTASVFALTILLLRTPLIGAVAALPTLLAARVSLKKLAGLQLAEGNTDFAPKGESLAGFKQLSLKGACYRYPDQDGVAGFEVGPLDLTVKRGELIFVQGGNGSGKSTFARLLTGLYRPLQGTLSVDGQPITEDNRVAYRQLFSSVFTDFYLFNRLLQGDGAEVRVDEVDDWLKTLGMQHKVRQADGRLSDIRFSQGQRKRLALLMAVMEQRDCLLLDEWAADQDPQFRQFFYHALLPRLQAQGKTIIAITHDDHYFDRADRLLKMDAGQLIELDGQSARHSVHALREAGA